MLSLQILLNNPNCKDGLNPEASKLFSENLELFKEKARMYVKKYALNK